MPFDNSEARIVGNPDTPHGIHPGTWRVDPDGTSLQFIARHFMVSKIRGKFLRFTGDIVIVDNPLDSTVTGSADATSVTTGDEARDDHLRSPDFFDVNRWPTLGLDGRVVEASSRGYVLRTDLTIRNVTRSVDFDLVIIGKDDTTLSVTARAAVNRKDFNLRWNATIETGGVVVADQVDLLLSVHATRVPAP